MDKKKIVIAVVAGHGKQVSGKFSPPLGKDLDIPSMFTDKGRFREWKYNRVIANDIVTILNSRGYNAQMVVTEDDDISLVERVNRVNKLCKKYGTENVIMLEIHANASGHGKEWMPARGWECYTTVGKTKSDDLAEFIYKRAEKSFKGMSIRKDKKDGDSDKEKDFYVIKHVKCPAILSENFFYTNKEDLKYMCSELGLFEVIRVHVEGTMDYIASL